MKRQTDSRQSAVKERIGRPLSVNRIVFPFRQPLSKEILDRTPPHDLKLERTVLGTIIVAWREGAAIGGLDAYDFHCWGYGNMFRELRSLRQRRLPDIRGMDLIRAAIRADLHIAEVAESIYESDWPHCRENIGKLRALRIRRERIFVATELLRLAYVKDDWDDASERQWIAAATTLLDNLKGKP